MLSFKKFRSVLSIFFNIEKDLSIETDVACDNLNFAYNDGETVGSLRCSIFHKSLFFNRFFYVRFQVAHIVLKVQ